MSEQRESGFENRESGRCNDSRFNDSRFNLSNTPITEQHR